MKNPAQKTGLFTHAPPLPSSGAQLDARDRFLPLICTLSLAEDLALLSIGPRFDISEKSPFLGKEQEHNFYLTDVAATFALPWSWPIGESRWSQETRLLTGAGVLSTTSQHGLMVTVIPGVAMSGWG